tara:strand:- start:208885 stop:210444 length:1560 start_codon:yes stop_codon:yes gene_type:complete
MLSLTQFPRRAAAINGHGIATICDGRKRTWLEFLARVQKAAGMLQNLGIEANDRVAILAPNSDTYMEYLFSVNWAGGVLVPINTRLADCEVADWINDAGAKILVVSDDFIDVLANIRNELRTVEQVICLGEDKSVAGMHSHEKLLLSSPVAADAGRKDQDLAALFYTGGTTGKSKGVMITHAGLYINILQWISAVGVTADDRFLIIPPMFHAAGGENSMAVAALAATAYIPPRFNALATLQAIEDERLTKLPVVATMLDMVVNHQQVAEFDLSSVRKITYGASPIHERVLTRSLEVFPQAEFFQVFGQTEGGPTVTVLPPKYHVTAGPHAGKLKSAGVPVIGVELKIVDDQDRQLRSGETGEICVRGAGVTPGYWNLPEATAEALRGGWMHTGDAGYLDEDGFLYIADRIKDMIISGAENVYPAEVEAVLLRHEAIIECAVIGIPSEKWGEQVHAIVRTAEGKSLTEQDLIDYCKQSLAGYKCIRSVKFTREAFPLSAANKVLKRELRKPYWENEGRSI